MLIFNINMQEIKNSLSHHLNLMTLIFPTVCNQLTFIFELFLYIANPKHTTPPAMTINELAVASFLINR